MEKSKKEPKNRREIRVLKLPYFDGDRREAVAIALSHIEDGTPFAVFTPGATIAARAERDPALLAAFEKGDLLLPDGYGCLLAARLCGKRLPTRIAGIDFAEALFEEAPPLSRVFLYGARKGVAARAASRLREKYPALIFAEADGYGDDPFERVRAFCPHIVCVCLGAPRQEAWICAHKGEIGGVHIGLGGSLDVWAGEVRRAPLFVQRMGLEWLWRTVKDPRRLPRLFPLPLYFGKCFLSRRCSKCQKKE